MSEANVQLRPDQVAGYEKDGYLQLDHFLRGEDVAALQEVTDLFVEQSRSVRNHTDVFDLEPGHTAEAPQLRRLKNPDRHHPVYESLVRDAGILDVVGQLIGPGIRFHGSKLNVKAAEVGSPVGWHQDWAFYPHTNDDVLAVGIAIDDMNVANGCLMVVAGSHRGPILDHHQDGVFVGSVDGEYVPTEVVPVELHAGGISVHHARLIHGSAPNVSTRPRRLLLFEYASADAWPLLGSGDDWEGYNTRLVRGTETAAPRMTPAPVRIPLPKPARSGSIYEIQSQRRAL
jgi:ectoine hydroxylase-related dioxygenase (phytanoyl-CoA dioxygenase family)